LIEEKTTYHDLHQVIVVEIATQMTILMMRRIKMDVIARAEEADVGNAMLEDHRFQERLLPI